MLEINKEKIRLSKGDHITIRLTTKLNGEDYQLQHGDRLEFTISKQDVDIIKKTFTSNLLVFTSEETNRLQSGKYRYDIRLYFKEGIDIALTYPNELEVIEGL